MDSFIHLLECHTNEKAFATQQTQLLIELLFRFRQNRLSLQMLLNGMMMPIRNRKVNDPPNIHRPHHRHNIDRRIHHRVAKIVHVQAVALVVAIINIPIPSHPIAIRNVTVEMVLSRFEPNTKMTRHKRSVTIAISLESPRTVSLQRKEKNQMEATMMITQPIVKNQ